MKEIQDIVRAYEAATLEGKRSALATVVQVEGSSYRRPGARMLVTEDGCLTGAISGGCLEGDALRKALLAIYQQRNKLVTYDTSEDGDARLGIQLGCNGIVYILFEPLGIDSQQIAVLRSLLASQQDHVLVTLFSLEGGDQPGLSGCFDGRTVNPISEISGWSLLRNDVQQSFSSKRSVVKSYAIDGRQLHALVEFAARPVSLVIVGAGNDARPLADLAHILGWHTTIVDGRSTHATPQRFPTAQRVIVARPEAVLEHVAVHPEQYFVLMTHNYDYDLQLMKTLMNEPVDYIGLLGPKTKWLRMLDDLSHAGIMPAAEQLKRVHAPTGLDLGAETAEEIALSIVAEIKAVSANTGASFLREKNQPIHSRSCTNHL